MTQPPDHEERRKGDNSLVRAVERLAATQAEDIEVKRQELTIRSQEISSQERIAIASIQAQERTVSGNRGDYNKHLIHKYIFVIVVLLVVGGFAGFLFVNDGKELVSEALKALLFFAAGALSGYGYKGRSKDEEE